MNQLQLRYNTLAAYNTNDSEIEELLAYNQNVFEHSGLKRLLQLFH